MAYATLPPSENAHVNSFSQVARSNVGGENGSRLKPVYRFPDDTEGMGHWGGLKVCRFPSEDDRGGDPELLTRALALALDLTYLPYTTQNLLMMLAPARPGALFSSSGRCFPTATA